MAETTKKAKAPKAEASKSEMKKAETTKAEVKEPAKKGAAKKKSEVVAEAAGTTATHAVRHEDVAKLAHHYYSQRGHQHGQHVDDWFRAEQELRGKAS